ncbi:MAG: hypothetical protein ACXWYP_09995 [Pseudonocardia sp.]
MVRAAPTSRAMRSAQRAFPVCTVEVTAPSVAAATPRSGRASANDRPVRRRLAVWQVSETTAAAGW